MFCLFFWATVADLAFGLVSPPVRQVSVETGQHAAFKPTTRQLNGTLTQFRQRALLQNTRSRSSIQAAGSAPQISRVTCDMAAAKLGAMSCSLVTQVSSAPEGCECRMQADTCPDPDPSFGFTGVNPSVPFPVAEMPGLTVILCLFWQWPRPGPLTDLRKKEAHERAQNLAETLANQARAAAALAAQRYLDPLTTQPPPPPPIAPFSFGPPAPATRVH